MFILVVSKFEKGDRETKSHQTQRTDAKREGTDGFIIILYVFGQWKHC